MSTRKGFEAVGLILAAAVAMLAFGLALRLDPAFLGLLIAVSSAGVLPLGLRWAKRNRTAAGD